MSKQIDSPGFYDFTAAEYHSDPCSSPSLSSSIAWEIEPSNAKAGSPEHGRLIHPKLGNQPKEQTSAMRFGSICHSMMLGSGSEFRVSPYDDYRSGKARDWRDETIDAGFIPVKQAEYDDAETCVKKWRIQLEDFELSGLFDKVQSKFEQVIAWKETFENDKFLVHKDGREERLDITKLPLIWCRAMLDIYCEECPAIWDIKTMPSAHPKKVMRKIVDEGLALRSEFYKRGIEKLKPELAGRIKSGFLFCSTESPYLILPVIQLNGQFRHVGKNQVERSIQTWGKCLADNKWSGYVETPIAQLECPSWLFKEEITEDSEDE